MVRNGLLILALAVALAPGQSPLADLVQAGDDEPPTKAVINGPSSLVIDQQGNIFVYEVVGGAVRSTDAASGVITTVAGQCSPRWREPAQPGALGHR